MEKLGLLQNQIKSINDKFEKINYGGCGTFSYYVSEILDKYGIDNQIVYLEEKKVPPRAFRCDIKFTHIYVHVDKYYIDNNGFYLDAGDVKVLPKEKLKDMLDEPRLWNSEFDEEKRKLLAKELINIKL